MNRDRNWIILWLCTGAIMVVAMVVIGGITRLTHSGLSMTDWKLIMGMIPPLNEAEWGAAFEQYKQFPEYQKINTDFTLSDFKSIFFWEYLHRLIGRIIGIVFIIPFAIFLIRKSLNRNLILKCLILLGLGALQGFLGWFMVKSGLVDRPSVSHFRLAIHLSAAFGTFCYILWVVLSLIYPERAERTIRSLSILSRILTVVIALQIIYGAFVAGLKAGWLYPTFPKMGDRWIPEIVGIALQSEGVTSLFTNMVSVQFMHRTGAYIVVLLVLIIWVIGLKNKLSHRQRYSINFLVGAVLLQFTLGVLTLLFHVPVSVAVAHQLGALLLLGGAISLVHNLPLKISK